MQIPLVKLKAILLYFANNANYLGKVKLMKLFYFLDFMHVKKYGISVTGDTYYNLEKGPIPTVIMNMVDELILEPESSKLADVIRVETPEGTTRMQKMMPQQQFTDEDKKLFSESEIDTLQEVLRLFKDTNTDGMIEASHKEAPWTMTEYRQEIPYSLAGKDSNSSFTSEEIEELNSL